MCRFWWAAASLALAGAAVAADPGYYVVAPYDNAGTLTAEARYWTVKRRTRGELVWPELGLSWGVNTRWTTGVLHSSIGPANLRTRQSVLNWWHTVLLTQGEWPVDVALFAQAVRDLQGTRRHAVEYGLLLQGDIARTQINFNLVWDRPRGAAAGEPTMLKLQWQLRHRGQPGWQAGLHLGLMGFDELGPWDRWAPHERQSHRVGPALWWAPAGGPAKGLELSAGWLEGKIYGRVGHMATLRVAQRF